MRAGLLSERITIESPTESRGTTGQAIKTWNSIGAVWARVQPLTARETIEAQSEQTLGNYVITTRYNSDITEKCRILYRGRYLNITSASNVNSKNAELSILATESK